MNEKMYEKRDLPKRSEDVSAWYNRVVLQAELADYGPAKGTMIFRPYGYGIWELLQKDLDRRIKERGVENAYFPLFIPDHLLQKEKSHVEGFSPELAVVTIGGGEELEEKLVIRPTSETIMYEAMARWIHSWRDLPMQLNQWNNAVRWEKRTYLFMRTSEFLWQEGHTVHATYDEAMDTVWWAAGEYERVYRDLFALPGYTGKKSESEKFAGADMTVTYEMLMPGGKALQASTSHDLGQNFSKAFGVSFQNKEGKEDNPWSTSWGFSTRSLGGLVLAHGDNAGLRLPPRVAPVQVVVLPIRPDEALIDYANETGDALREGDIRVKVDKREDRIGSKHNDWELKGVPVRIEIGNREVESGEVTLVRRDTSKKLTVARDQLVNKVSELLEEIQDNLLKQAEEFLAQNTREVGTWDEFKRIMENERGFIRAFWCEDRTCEERIKEETKATVRVLPKDAKEESGKCVRCGNDAKFKWLFALAY